MQGRGRFVAAQGKFTYEGNWSNDQPNGQGIERSQDGSTY